MIKGIKFSIILALIIFLCLGNSVAQETNQVKVNSYSAVITWITDKPSTSQVEYGIDNTYGNTSPPDNELVTFHKVALNNLSPSTKYHYRVRSKDAFGNEAISGDFVFVTLKEPPADSPPQISDVQAEAIVAAGLQTQETKPVLEKSEKELASEQAGQLVKKEEPIEKTLIQKGGILLPRGKLQIEPAFTYAHVSANRISILGYTILPVLVIGEISSEKVKRDIFIQSVTGRYGLRDNLQLELKIPYRQQYERISVSDTSETTRSLSGLGDIEGGVYYQFAYERGAFPDMILGLSVKSKTGKSPYGRDIGLGTGHWAVKTSMVAVKSSDPGIIFAGLGYTWNIKRDISGYGEVDPGDTFSYNLGYAFALNYQLALSFQLEHLITTKMLIDNRSVAGSFTNVANFKYGLTWSISKNLSCDVTVSQGLTEDSPDFSLEVRFPYTF